MGPIHRKIASLFSTRDSSDLLAALMDTLAVAIVTFPLWVAFTTLIDPSYIGAPFSAAALIGLYIYSAMTLAVSYITIAMMEEHGTREKPRDHRSTFLTTIAVLLAIATPVGGVMTLRGTFDLHTGLELFVSLGLICVPAAIRLSGPTAFMPQHHNLDDRLVAIAHS